MDDAGPVGGPAFEATKRVTLQPIGWLLGYFAVVFLGAALLAPWLYTATQWLSARIELLQPLASQPFHRYVNRCLILLGAIGLWPLLRGLRLNAWQAVGFRRLSKESWNHFGQGFLLGFISLALAAIGAVLAGARVWDQRTAWEFAAHIAGALATALVVGVLEELLFRGALFGALRKAMLWPAALIVSSAIYALLHFFERPAPPESVHWHTGLTVLVKMCRGFGDWEALVPGFLNLTLAGAILAFAYQRFGTLYFSIGLHAGWIFWLKSYGFMTDAVKGADGWVWGSRKLTDGWAAMLLLCVVWLFVWVVRPRRSRDI